MIKSLSCYSSESTNRIFSKSNNNQDINTRFLPHVSSNHIWQLFQEFDEHSFNRCPMCNTFYTTLRTFVEHYAENHCVFTRNTSPLDLDTVLHSQSWINPVIPAQNESNAQQYSYGSNTRDEMERKFHDLLDLRNLCKKAIWDQNSIERVESCLGKIRLQLLPIDCGKLDVQVAYYGIHELCLHFPIGHLNIHGEPTSIMAPHVAAILGCRRWIVVMSELINIHKVMLLVPPLIDFLLLQ